MQGNRSEADCGSQPQANEQQAEQELQDQQQQEQQQADLRQSGRKRKLSPRAAEAAAAAAAQAAADPDGAEIAAEVHAVAGVGGTVAGILAPRDTAECMSSMRRNAAAAAQKGKSKRQKMAGNWSVCEGSDMLSAQFMGDVDMLGMHASVRGAGMVTRGHRTAFEHAGVSSYCFPVANLFLWWARVILSLHFCGVTMISKNTAVSCGVWVYTDDFIHNF